MPNPQIGHRGHPTDPEPNTAISPPNTNPSKSPGGSASQTGEIAKARVPLDVGEARSVPTSTRQVDITLPRHGAGKGFYPVIRTPCPHAA